jgi:hypothetical protein
MLQKIFSALIQRVNFFNYSLLNHCLLSELLLSQPGDLANISGFQLQTFMENCKISPNKRMQSDQPTRYARGLAADARRYVANIGVSNPLL